MERKTEEIDELSRKVFETESEWKDKLEKNTLIKDKEIESIQKLQR